MRFSEEDKQTIWDTREAGVQIKRIAKHLGQQISSLRKFIADAGGRGRVLGCEARRRTCGIAEPAVP